MPFTDSDWRFIGLLKLVGLGLIVMLAACSQVPHQETSADSESHAAEATDGFEPMPDPYLTQKRSLPEQVQRNFSRAQHAMEAGNWKEAQGLLEQITRDYPSLSGPYVNLGLVYRYQGKVEQAEQAFSKAIEVNSLNGEAYNQLAILHREQGEFSEAEQRYLQALRIWPHNPVVHRNLGILYDLYMGRFDDALEHYRMSRKVAPEEDRQLEGWIVDLERRLAEQQAAVQ